MGERIDYLVSRLRGEGEALAAQVDMLSAEQWTVPVYTGQTTWTAKDVMAHLVSTERGLMRLIANIADGGPGAPPDFDYEAFNTAEVAALSDRSPAELVADFRAARADVIALVARLDDGVLDRRGRHPALGEIGLEEFIKTVYRHDKLHARDVVLALSG
jgi:uncharacterized protein (TIGR03083 family)